MKKKKVKIPLALLLAQLINQSLQILLMYLAEKEKSKEELY